MQKLIETYTQSKDVAWASINTPCSVNELKLFCQDIERLFRINPMLNFKQWQMLDNQCYHFAGQNISQEEPFDFDLLLNVSPIDNGIRIEYQQGLKACTFFIFEHIDAQTERSARLTIIDDYSAVSKTIRKQQLHTVDKSIAIWAEHLQRYLLSWKRWSHIGPWRWYMQNIWQPMRPSGRRIIYILLWVAMLEVALILLGAVIYYLEYHQAGNYWLKY